LLKVIRSYKNC